MTISFLQLHLKTTSVVIICNKLEQLFVNSYTVVVYGTVEVHAK